MKIKYFHRTEEDKKLVKAIKNIIGFRPDNIFLYKLAFKHRSAAELHENGTKICNERLEYLGDAILSAIVADFLFKKFPYRDEGFLTEMRSKMVSRDNLNKLSAKLAIKDLIEHNDNNVMNKSIYGDAFEALIGAVYLDFGYKKTKKLIIGRIIKFHIDVDGLEQQEINFKSKLIEWCQKEKKTIEFKVMDEDIASSGKLYKIAAVVDGEIIGEGKDFSKKRAEQYAAEKACEKIFQV